MEFEISNKAIAFLLLIAIVTSIGGTFLSLDRLGTLRPGATGAATGQGTVDVLVDQDISITIAIDAIDFVIGSHEVMRAGGLYNDLKCFCVYLTNGAFRTAGIGLVPTGFLIVEPEVFRRC